MIEPKSKNSWRSITVPLVLTGLLHQHRLQQEAERALLGIPLKEEDLILACPDGSPLDPSTVTHAFGKVLKSAGLRHIRFHDLRHTHARCCSQTEYIPRSSRNGSATARSP